MDIAAWVVQGLLAFAFGMAGFMKFTQPYDKLKAQMAWVEDFSPNIIKAIGGLEVLGAIGLILPMLTNLLPILTPLAAGGLVLTMLGAALTHARRKEYSAIAINGVLLALAAFVIYARLIALPVA